MRCNDPTERRMSASAELYASVSDEAGERGLRVLGTAGIRVIRSCRLSTIAHCGFVHSDSGLPQPTDDFVTHSCLPVELRGRDINDR